MMDCIPGLEYSAQTGTINSSCAPRRTENRLAVSETEKDVAEQSVICHYSGSEDAMGGLLGTIGHAEDAPSLYSCSFLRVFQKGEGNVLPNLLGKALCSTVFDGLLHESFYVVSGYFLGWLFKELSSELHELLDEVTLLEEHDLFDTD